VKEKLPLPQNKKLTIVFNVEPGCLGQNGMNHVEDFCQFTQNKIKSINSDIIIWEVLPRYDKSQPEIQYKLNNKKLSNDKAAKLLALFDQKINEIEVQLEDKIIILIEQYLGR